jgi:AcrR family transcriptional regulator
LTTVTESRQPITRRDVLAHSAELFASKGYKATNLRMVADRMGVTRQALYYHFTNKAEILAALFDEQMTAFELAAAEAIPSDGEARFTALIRAHLEVILRNVDLTAVLVHERPETDGIEGLRAAQRRRAYTRQIADAYAEGVKEGKLRDLEPQRAANIMLAACNGVSWWYHPTRSSLKPSQALADTMAVLETGFVKPAGRRPSRAPKR